MHFDRCLFVSLMSRAAGTWGRARKKDYPGRGFEELQLYTTVAVPGTHGHARYPLALTVALQRAICPISSAKLSKRPAQRR